MPECSGAAGSGKGTNSLFCKRLIKKTPKYEGKNKEKTLIFRNFLWYTIETRGSDLMEFAFQETFSAAEVKIIRKKLKLKQRELAELMNVSVKTVERWECGAGEVKGSAAVLLAILREKMWLVEEFEIPEKKLPVRLRYMYNDQLCTIIDVDDPARNVKIKNFVVDPVLRAFGKEEHPSYEDYEAFLESRCFPRTRDKMKIVLRELNLPFYDPFMIIQKTQGRMAEDDFWIQIER